MKFIRYLGVQGAAYGLDMGGFLFFFRVTGLDPLLANVLGKLLAGIFAFLSHRSFTFRLAPEQHDHRQVWKYFLLLAFNIPLSSAVLLLMLQFIALPVLAKFCADVVCVCLTYWLSRKYVFTSSRQPSAETQAGVDADS